MLHYFGVSSIGISRVRVSRLANTWGPHLGTSGAEMSKYNNFSTLYLLGFRKSGFRDLRVQGNSPSDIPDAEIPKYRDLATRCHFGISQVGVSGLASTRELALGFPGYRNSEIPTLKPAHLISGFLPSGFRKSGFRDLRVQGNSHLGTPGAETPKCPNPSTRGHFGISRFGVLGLASTRCSVPKAEPRYRS
jgi:hypothetical protein